MSAAAITKTSAAEGAAEEEDPWNDLELDDADLAQLCATLDTPIQSQDNSRLRTAAQHEGFDNNTGDSWIYPTNLPQRSYQYTIAHAALFRNTLVVLPTGLGKTFIAAVVMYNIYRWYPRGKVIFMAPTRPLVAQQIEACQRIMPFPAADTVELTGKLARTRRTELWRTKRVFFATPQSVRSDILGGEAEEALDFPYSAVKLLVVDEAHKAKGKYAYTEVTQAILQRNAYFRVLALSATPGRTVDDVAEVVRNLLISHLEVRWDTSIDVAPYVHQRSMRTIVVPLGDDIRDAYDELLQIIDPYLRQLIDAEVLGGSSSPAQMNRNFLLYEQKRFRERSLHQRHPQHGAVTSNFSICISLYHALELLERHGLRVFLNNFEEDEEGRGKFVVNMDRRLRDLLERLREQLGPNPFEVSAHAMTNGRIAEMPSDLDFGHPKFEQARGCLVAHFQENPESRAIVFCEYRESVMLIYRLLLQHKPLLKPRCFVGQGGTTGSLRALTQKQQIQIMKDFREGTSNILIATSIGEEGIDVGEVELIVCFDISTSNPTRFIQRIGRTGRRKSGNVVMLVTEGREQQLLKDVLATKDQTNKKLLRSAVVQRELYKHAPRLVPTEYNPQCVHTFVKPPADEIVVEEVKGNSSKKTKGKTAAKPPIKGSQDLRKFFKKPSLQAPLDAEDMEVFQMCTRPTQPPSTQARQQSEKSLHEINEFFNEIDMSAITPATNTQLLSTQSTDSKPMDLKPMDSKPVDLEAIDTKPVDSNPVDPKFMRKIDKLLKTTPLVPPAERIEDVWEQLRCKTLSRESKLLLLKLKPELIRQALERLDIVAAVNDAETSMSQDEAEIRENYRVIEELCGGSKESTANFLEDAEYEQYKQKCYLRNDPYSEPITEKEFLREEAAFMACVDRIFAGCPEPDWRNDNFDYIQEKLKKSEHYQKIMNNKEKTPPLGAESMVYDTLLDSETMEYATQNPINANMTDSKYCSQWDEFARAELPNRSTPVQGPLARAFKRQEKKAKSFNLMQRLDESREDGDVILLSDDEDILETLGKPLIKDAAIKEERKVDGYERSKARSEKDNKARESIKVNKRTNGNLDNYVPDKNDDLEVNDYNIKCSQRLDKLETNSENSMDLVDVPAEKYDRFSKYEDELDTSPSCSRKIQTKTEHKTPPNQTLSHNDSTPDDLEVSLHKLSIALAQNAAASTPNLHAKDFRKVEDILKEEKNALLNELDFDMEAFMEPFPEEELLVAHSSKPAEATKPLKTLSPAKLNTVTSNRLLPAMHEEARNSPDLFAWDEEILSPAKAKPNKTSPAKLSLAAKLAAKAATISASQPPQTPPKLITTANKTAVTPKHQTIVQSQKYETSPSIFDMYLKHTRRPGATITKSPLTRLAGNKTANCDSPADDHVIRKPNPRKRKIFDSDSENEPEQSDAIELAEESESDEIAATQQLRRAKPRRLAANSFLQQEAAVSGSDQSEDEAEHTLGHYLLDSVVVSSEGEPEPDAASTSHQQAMYLQSLKSPVQRRGAFKIPTFRVFNDQSHIFSQAVPVEDSQYLPNSFVVTEENESALDAANVSMCPLERAEQILKERRRARRKFGQVAVVHNRKKRKVCRLADDGDSSDN